MPRNVLLIEPDYKNKYPPLGLMKLATYHGQLGDYVRFFKGNLADLIIEEIADMMIAKFTKIDANIPWHKSKNLFMHYIGKGTSAELFEMANTSNYFMLLTPWFEHYRKYYKSGGYKNKLKWDRICISTLFTFYWDITIKTIEKAKELVKDTNQIFVGGVLATVLHNELKETTGVQILPGLLNYRGALDNNDIIIDTLPLDYSILFETDYNYPANNAFFTYATRGCPNHCPFCAVPTLENKFNQYISIKETIKTVQENYGDMSNLLLLDNNVLASDKFECIIEDIKKSGFAKGAVFTEPDYLSIYLKGLNSGYNDFGFSRALHKLFIRLFERAKSEDKQKIYTILSELDLLNINYLDKKSLLSAGEALLDFYKKYRSDSKRRRIVDFNQGLEASKITEKKAKLLSEIAINPLRIAFDNFKEEKIYKRAINYCAKYEIKSFSNYLLYNFNDKPVDLYRRLKINIMLCEKLKISIYSFPMKYHPITGEYSKNRDFIGEYWNRKYIRAIQIILNATKGKIGRGKSFFYKAFGKTINEFHELLLMPESYLLYRLFFENIGKTHEWKSEYKSLSVSERHDFFKLIKDNIFSKEKCVSIKSPKMQKLYKHYLITRKDLEDASIYLGQAKIKYDADRTALLL